jgi:hypothetical protein
MKINTVLEDAGRDWQEFRKALGALKGGAHPGANVLSLHRDQMVFARERLLKLGLDLADLRNPEIVPVPVSQHPKTAVEVRAWETEIAFRSDQSLLCWSVTGVGTHVVYSAVGRDALRDALLPYVEETADLSSTELLDLISESNLDVSALASVLWLLEPTGSLRHRAGELDAACLERMLYAMEVFPVMKNAKRSKDSNIPETERNTAAAVLGGWSLANISLKGRAGGRLRQALGAEVPDRVQYARLLEELPGATQIAWEEKRPEESLRPNGSRDKSLIRRVAAIIEGGAGEAVMHPGKVSDKAQNSEELIGAEDQSLAEFELEESLRQDLSWLKLWVERAKFSEQEHRIYELDMRTDHDTAAIAQELKISPDTVRQHRKRYRDKLRKAAGL